MLEPLPPGHISLQKLGRTFQGPLSGCKLWTGAELGPLQLFLEYFLSNKAKICFQSNNGPNTVVFWALCVICCIILCASALNVFCQYCTTFWFGSVLSSLWKYNSMHLIPARKPALHSDLRKLYLSWKQSLYLGFSESHNISIFIVIVSFLQIPKHMQNKYIQFPVEFFSTIGIYDK